MDVVEALHSRYAARAFKPDPVEKETIVKILTAATRAPSWGNTQPWEIFVVSGEPLERLRKAFLQRFDEDIPSLPEYPKPQEWPPTHKQLMVENTERRFEALGIKREDAEARRANNRRNFEFFGAPVVVYLCMDRTLTAWSFFDIGMLAQSIMLAARDYGIDSITAINFAAYPDLIRKELEIPDNLLILIGVALGYADPDQPVNKYRSLRRPIEEVVRFKGL